MQTRTQPRVEPLLSIQGSRRWLEEKGCPISRHGIYLALARQELRAKEIVPGVWRVRLPDLEAFARERMPASRSAA